MLSKELLSTIENNTVSHAYLFLDEEMAFEFAKALSPLAVDFILQEDLLTKDIETMQEQLKFKPFGDRRVVLIRHADNMQAVVQNKLLKTLEEPIGNTVLILSAERRDAMLPTILSRCIEIVGNDKDLAYSKEAYKLAKDFADAKALFYERRVLIDEIVDKDYAISFLNALEEIYREELLKSLDAGTLSAKIKTTEEIRKNIINGLSLSIALKTLALNI